MCGRDPGRPASRGETRSAILTPRSERAPMNRSPTFLLAGAWLVAVGTAPSAQEAADPESVQVGLRKQLLVDDFIIAKRVGVTRELGKATKANNGNPVFPDCWWAASVHREKGVFKAWYIQRRQDFRYKESESKWAGSYDEPKDGHHCTKRADLETAYGPVLIDPHETDPDHRFKAAPLIQAPDYFSWAAGLSHSRDGIRWVFYNDRKPVTGPFGDFTNQILWDEEAK